MPANGLLDRPAENTSPTTLPKSKTSTPPVPLETATLEFLASRYPERMGWKRKIAFLWKTYYRITYMHIDDGISVTSVFVEVPAIGKVIEHK
jgi:hypothetical protein